MLLFFLCSSSAYKKSLFVAVVNFIFLFKKIVHQSI
jgi:hypothetical protein